MGKGLYLGVSSFFNRYHNQLSQNIAGPAFLQIKPSPTHLLLPAQLRQQVLSEPIPVCHVLFVPADVPRRPALLEGLDPGVLTVGDGEEFLRQGGMVASVIPDRGFGST